MLYFTSLGFSVIVRTFGLFEGALMGDNEGDMVVGSLDVGAIVVGFIVGGCLTAT